MPAWSDDAIAALTRHRWPGNVRELANIVERLAILHAGRTVTETDVAAVLPRRARAACRANDAPSRPGVARPSLERHARRVRANAHLARAVDGQRERGRSGATAEDRPAEPVSPNAAARDSGRRRVTADVHILHGVDMRRTFLTLLGARVPGVGAAQAAPAVRAAARLAARRSPRSRRPLERRERTRCARRSRLEIAAGREVRGDVVVQRGPLIIGGHVTGNVLALNCDVVLRAERAHRRRPARVGGEVDGREHGAHRRRRRASIVSRCVYREDGDRIVAITTARRSDDIVVAPPRATIATAIGAKALRVVQAGPYNRVEGLPIELGPVIQRLHAVGQHSRRRAPAIVRTGSSFGSEGSDIGHNLRGEVRFGRERGDRRRRQRVQRRRPGRRLAADRSSRRRSRRSSRDATTATTTSATAGTAFVTLYGARNLSLTGSYGEERWSSRVLQESVHAVQQRRSWRAESRSSTKACFTSRTLSLKFDTRTDPDDPWSGWFCSTDLEYGARHVRRTSRPTSARVARRRLRRSRHVHARILRLPPLQSPRTDRRSSTCAWCSAAGSTAIRCRSSDASRWTDRARCRATTSAARAPARRRRRATTARAPRATRAVRPHRARAGRVPRRPPPRLHEPVGGLAAELSQRAWRRRVRRVRRRGPRMDRRSPARRVDDSAVGVIPPLSTFRTDVGVGLDFGGIGIYAAKALSTSDAADEFLLPAAASLLAVVRAVVACSIVGSVALILAAPPGRF